MPRRALLIVNEKSRNGAANLEASRERLKAYGIEPIYRDCERREDLSPLIVEQGKEVDLVVIGGGDGTINAAAEGVIEERSAARHPAPRNRERSCTDPWSSAGPRRRRPHHRGGQDAADRSRARQWPAILQCGFARALGGAGAGADRATSSAVSAASATPRRLARALAGPALQRHHLEPRGHGAREDAPDRRRQRALLRRRQRRRERAPRSTTSISISTASSSTAPGSWR